MKQTKTTLLIMMLGLIAFTSCQKENDHLPDELKYRDLPGRYEIVAIQSQQQVDLKGDGNATTDLYRQIGVPKYVNNVDDQIAYAFTDISLYPAEIRPISGSGQPDIPNAFFLLPMQVLEEKTDLASRWKLSHYMSSFISCHYEFNSDGNIVLKNVRDDSLFPFNKIKEIKRVHAGKFTLLMSLNLFDFSINNWRLTDVVITYERVNM